MPSEIDKTEIVPGIPKGWPVIFARNDALKAIDELIGQPRGTHAGRSTGDSALYVSTLRHIKHLVTVA